MSAHARVKPISEEEQSGRSGFMAGEAAYILGLSYDVTLDRIRKGELRAVRSGKFWIVSKREIDRFLGGAA